MKVQIRFMGSDEIYPIANAPYVLDIIKSIKKDDIVNIKGLGNLKVFTTYDEWISHWNAYEIVVLKEEKGVAV